MFVNDVTIYLFHFHRMFFTTGVNDSKKLWKLSEMDHSHQTIFNLNSSISKNVKSILFNPF